MGAKVLAVGAFTRVARVEDVELFRYVTAKRAREIQEAFCPDNDAEARDADGYGKAIDREFDENCWDMGEPGLELWMVRPERTQVVVQPEDE